MAGEAVEVGQFVAFARSALVNEPYLSNAAIIGGGKFTQTRSGHTYFTLTDNQGSIDCVLFGGNHSFISQESGKARNLSRLEESTSM